jgi:hypothetical protein
MPFEFFRKYLKYGREEKNPSTSERARLNTDILEIIKRKKLSFKEHLRRFSFLRLIFFSYYSLQYFLINKHK